MNKQKTKENQFEIDEISGDIHKLRDEINDAQYGLGETDEDGKVIEDGMTGEQREISRLENESLP